MVVRLPETKKYLNRDGLKEYNSLLPHSSAEIQEYVNDWLDAHPEATTTVQDGSITTQKLADGSVTRNKLAADVAHLLGGMMVTGEVQGEILSADDAYSVAPLSMEIEGKSTQAGTPTPDNPIPIQSIETLNMILHASADGANDYGNWPVSVPMDGYVLRSLPNNTKDTLALTYLHPSTREGWAWYSREVVQRVFVSTYDGDEGWRRNYDTVYYRTALTMRTMTNGRIELMCDKLACSATRSLASARNSPPNTILGRAGENDVVVRTEQSFASAAEFSAWLTENPIAVYFPLANPVTTQLDPIELPILPAPECTVWSDPATGLKMSYMRDTNIVVSNIEQAIADL